MTTKQNFTALGSITFAMVRWIKLRQWAVRNGDKITEANATLWIDDCKARGQRINKLEREEREEGDDEALGDPDLAHWSLGAQLRSRGSIHSDEWRGNAAQLAAKSHIAVFPVGGWWKDWKESERYETEVRYALVITLEVLDEVDVDLYTPIAAMLQVPAVIQVPAAGD